MESSQKAALEMALTEFGEIRVRLGGWSMWPFIKNGEEVLLVVLSKSGLRGKVVAYFAHSQLIVHRVLREEGQPGKRRLKVAGDFNPKSAVWFGEGECLAEVAGVFEGDAIRRFGVSGSTVFLGLFFSYLVKLFKKPPIAK